MLGTMKQKLDKLWVGLALGILGPFIGFYIYSLIKFPQYSFSWYLEFFMSVEVYQSSIMSLSLLFNLLLFFVFIYTNTNRAARGVLMATLIFAPFVVYFRFF